VANSRTNYATALSFGRGNRLNTQGGCSIALAGVLPFKHTPLPDECGAGSNVMKHSAGAVYEHAALTMAVGRDFQASP